MERRKVFRSRISVLLLGFFLAAYTPLIVLMIKHMILMGLYIMGGALMLILFLLSGMRYIISGDKLYVKMLWIIPFGSVKISDIASVERSYNPLSSPAASFKRLQLGLRNAVMLPYMLISPVREQEFMKELKAVNPNISVQVPVQQGTWRVQDWDI